MDLQQKLDTRQAVVAVIGMGYVGLPIAVLFAEAGFPVVGIDLDKTKVDSLGRGDSYIQDISSNTLRKLVPDGSVGGPEPGKLTATSYFESLREADAVIVCVPTPLSKTRDPDVSYIVSATDEIAKHLHRGMVVVLESTTYPGTTEEVILPRLQTASDEPLMVGSDFFLAFSPERIDPGREDFTVQNTPKVVGGVTSSCTQAASALYGCVIKDVVPVASAQVAEMVKLLENTFRATNIALVNEVAIICDRLGINVWEVIEAAKTKPFGFMPFYPGPGLGGHCIPIDPQYLAWKLRTLDYDARFIRLAEEINLAMPLYWVSKVQDELNRLGKPVNGSSVLVLGVAYKKDIDDTRESPALDIIEELLKKGAQVTYHDPGVPTLETESYRMSSIENDRLGQALSEADCVMIVADHSDYDWDQVRKQASLVVDTRNALGGKHSIQTSIADPR